MGLINFIKRIKYVLSRDACYEDMRKRGYAFFQCCGGRVGGDKYTEYLSYDCVDCPYYVDGFSVKDYTIDNSVMSWTKGNL